MTLGTILAIMAVKYIQMSIPQWNSDVERWIKKDKEGFLKFKTDVFNIVNSSIRSSESNGYEIIQPKK